MHGLCLTLSASYNELDHCRVFIVFCAKLDTMNTRTKIRDEKCCTKEYNINRLQRKFPAERRSTKGTYREG